MPRKHSQLVVFHNHDKQNHERWDRRRALANIPHPWRGIACGPPNSGKSSYISNLIAWADPAFQRIIVSSVDPTASEWTAHDDEGLIEVVEGIPDFREFDPNTKTLVILEDKSLTNLRGEEAELLDRLYGHGSTHRNCSVVSSAQDIYRLPLCVRRNANLFALWRTPDLNSLRTIAERVGLKRGELADLFDLCKSRHDFVVVDMTDGSPAPLRLNLTTPIERD